MSEWEGSAKLGEEAARRLRQSIRFFDHTTTVDSVECAGIDGSGDYPALAYGDSFVYLTVAQGSAYAADTVHGLREVDTGVPALFDVFWIPQSEQHRSRVWDATFERMCGLTLREVVAASDYRELKARWSGRRTSVSQLVEQLIRPHASDASNVAIQLRTTGELAIALQLLRRYQQGCTGGPTLLIFDSTMTLPLVTRRDVSLFYEHLKRLCCVEARQRGIVFAGLSKSHGLSGIDFIESAAAEAAGNDQKAPAEHWYLKVPTEQIDGWALPGTDGRRLPPAGAVTYLVRFHRNVPVLRVDFDEIYCAEHLRDESSVRSLFQSLDYCSHDQRCFGYPYPVRAAHNQASLMDAERVALRKQLIDEAVRAGMKRSHFRDASQPTGHA
jgi:hypothetical protein